MSAVESDSRELGRFFSKWDHEAKRTVDLLKTLPADRYDFRPDPEGKSLGELAWHLAEIDGFFSYSIVAGEFRREAKVPNLERPKSVEALAPGYERIHREAVERLKGALRTEDLDRELPFFGGRMMKIRHLLWGAVLHHLIHHRGQLSLMNRLAGGTGPGLYGPTREEAAAMRAKGTSTPPR